jgi:hypothetical protein
MNGIMPSEMILISPSFSPWQLVLLGQLEAEGCQGKLERGEIICVGGIPC